MASHNVTTTGCAAGVHFAILLQFRSSECELCIAWVEDEALDPSAGRQQSPVVPCRVGTVHFVTLSCTCVRVSRAVIWQESRGHRVAVQDLMVKELGGATLRSSKRIPLIFLILMSIFLCIFGESMQYAVVCDAVVVFHPQYIL